MNTELNAKTSITFYVGKHKWRLDGHPMRETTKYQGSFHSDRNVRYGFVFSEDGTFLSYTSRNGGYKRISYNPSTSESDFLKVVSKFPIQILQKLTVLRLMYDDEI